MHSLLYKIEILFSHNDYHTYTKKQSEPKLKRNGCSKRQIRPTQ